MEIMGAAFAAAIIVSFLERRDRAQSFPPGPCRYCPEGIHLEGDGWVHDNGEAYLPWPNLRYDLGLTTPLHRATPLHPSTVALS